MAEDRIKCSVCGAQRNKSEMIQYSQAPMSKSGKRKYFDIWYCADQKHNLTFLARIAARKQRP